MDIFLAGTDVTVTPLMQDALGNPIVADSVDYRIADESGVELVARTPLLSFTSGDTSLTITVPAAMNALPAGAPRGLRAIELYLKNGTNVTLLTASYVIELTDVLIIGVNSFMTYVQAEFTALSIPNITAWDAAAPEARVAALMDARAHIVQLSFTPLNSNVNWGQDSLNFIPEGSYPTDYVGNSNMFLFNGNLDLLRPIQFASLPTRFLDVLKKAQVTEADSILGGHSILDKRREGLTQDNIGESRQSYRQGKPLDLPVCRRALAYLSYYITFAKKIGRM